MFFEMFKIGLFTFGGGYAMIGMMERELVEKKKWIMHEEFMDLIAIAESTPGPLAINSATYIGYKRAGFLGSLFCTLGVVLPSFIIIFVISLFFDKFLELKFVQYAFRGIQACVAFLILSAGIKMFRKLKKNALNVTLFIASLVALILVDIFALNFSTIFFILIGGAIGLVLYFITVIKERNNSKKQLSQSGDQDNDQQKGDEQ